MKKILSLLIIAAWAMTVQAQTTLKVSVEQTVPQKEWELTLALETEVTDFAAMEFMTDHFMEDFTIEAIEPLEALANHSISYQLYPAPPQAVNQEYFSRVVVYSPSGALFGTGNLLKIKLKSAGDALLPENENHWFDIYNIVLAYADGSEEELIHVDTNIRSIPDGIAGVSTSAKAQGYTLTGQKLGRVTKQGVYIINGKKVVVK